MANMQVTVGFRRKPGMDRSDFAFLQIIFNNFFNKIQTALLTHVFIIKGANLPIKVLTCWR